MDIIKGLSLPHLTYLHEYGHYDQSVGAFRSFRVIRIQLMIVVNQLNLENTEDIDRVTQEKVIGLKLLDSEPEGYVNCTEQMETLEPNIRHYQMLPCTLFKRMSEGGKNQGGIKSSWDLSDCKWKALLFGTL